jgi:hypothetical protein
MQFLNKKPINVASEILSFMEKHTSSRWSQLEITAGVHIACRLFVLPNAPATLNQAGSESVSEQRESLSVA